VCDDSADRHLSKSRSLGGLSERLSHQVCEELWSWGYGH
jgi:hypothetical protein